MSSTDTEKKVNSDFDIMIVGGGPAGVSTWLHLHKYAPELAARTVLIEKEQYPRDKICGGAIIDWGQYILKKLGIQINIPNVSINNAIYRYCNEEYCHKVPDFLKIVRRFEFDYFLAKDAISRGLELRQNEVFIDYSNSNDGLLVNTNKKKYNVKVLVGADGALSKVRANMNLSTKLRFATGIEVFSPVNNKYDSEFENNTSIMDFTYAKDGLQGYVWHFPCIKKGKMYMNHGICNARVNTDKKMINVKNIFLTELKSRNINMPISSWQGGPVPWNDDFSEISRPNVILVGDAAGIEPLIGGGIHLSLSYGKLAKDAIINAFKNNDYSFGDYSDRFMNHNVGKYINRLTYLAHEIYAERMNVIDVLQKTLNNKH
jgi:flavin-dependent dehydrogenase